LDVVLLWLLLVLVHEVEVRLLLLGLLWLRYRVSHEALYFAEQALAYAAYHCSGLGGVLCGLLLEGAVLCALVNRLA